MGNIFMEENEKLMIECVVILGYNMTIKCEGGVCYGCNQTIIRFTKSL